MSSNYSKLQSKIKIARLKVLSELNKLSSTYVVKPGDTLSDLATTHYNNPDEWPTIYNANKAKIQDPNLIEPGWTLTIPPEPTGANPPAGYQPPVTQPKTVPQDVEKYVEDAGLVDLRSIATVKNYPYAHPQLAKLLSEIVNLKGVEFWRVTEGFPPTSKHKSRRHYDGRAIDFTIRNPEIADELVAWINKQPGFKALNEYRYKTTYSTGGHIDVQYLGPVKNNLS